MVSLAQSGLPSASVGGATIYKLPDGNLVYGSGMDADPSELSAGAALSDGSSIVAANTPSTTVAVGTQAAQSGQAADNSSGTGFVMPNVTGAFITHLQGGTSTDPNAPAIYSHTSDDTGNTYTWKAGGTLLIQDANNNIFSVNVATGAMTDPNGAAVPKNVATQLLLAVSNFQDTGQSAGTTVAGIIGSSTASADGS